MKVILTSNDLLYNKNFNLVDNSPSITGTIDMSFQAYIRKCALILYFDQK